MPGSDQASHFPRIQAKKTPVRDVTGHVFTNGSHVQEFWKRVSMFFSPHTLGKEDRTPKGHIRGSWPLLRNKGQYTRFQSILSNLPFASATDYGQVSWFCRTRNFNCSLGINMFILGTHRFGPRRCSGLFPKRVSSATDPWYPTSSAKIP